MSLSPFPTPTGPLLTDQNVISAANFGPMTTIFTPPVDCTAALTMRESANLYFGYSAAGYFDPYCFPFGTKSRDAIVNTFGPNYYYSPAICPLDWTAVATFTSISSLFDNTGFVTIRPGTTAILCCPSGYKYARNGHLCGSTVTKGQKYIYVLPVNDGMGYNRGPTMENFAMSSMTVEGNGVPVWWQQSDEAVLSKASITTQPSTSQPISTDENLYQPTNQQPPTRRSQASHLQATATSTASFTPTKEPLSQSSGGLPSGARIGLGVSIPLVITVALLLGIFLWRRRRYQAGHINTAQAYMPKSHAYVTQPLGAYTAPVEIYTVPAEAPSDFHGRHELPDESK